MPSMLYLNNPLEECRVNHIKIETAKHMGRTSQQVAWQRFGPQLLAAISCSIVNLQGHVVFNLTAEYDLVPPNAIRRLDLTQGTKDEWKYAAEQNLFQFVLSNNTAEPAMWWAESLMSFSWIDTALKMEQANNVRDNDKGEYWQGGSLSFRSSGTTADISSSSFFNVSYSMLMDDGLIVMSGTEPITIDGNSTDPFSLMLVSADSLAKAFYSTISADLGVVNGPNILTNQESLQQFTSDYGNIEIHLIAAGPASDSYDTLKTVTGEPKVTESTIFTTYLCQTPVRKLTPALIISVLLANLVLLRALWSVMTLVAVQIVDTRDPKGKFPSPKTAIINKLSIYPANYCMRCAEYESIPLLEESLPIGHPKASSRHTFVD
ncbi:hypothetical protein Ptr902_08180 [Pyrenophora tritici-repentis]|nr:hypothetical protein Ptr902_08180 [Pyrenophora tritici-repentis]